MPEPSFEERFLLQQVAEGDEKAFHVLYDQYSPRIYSLGMHLTRDTYMARELVQDIFEKLWKKRDTLPSIGNFPAYIKAMVRNTTNNHLKRMAHERLILQRMASDQPLGEFSTDAAMEQGHFRRLLQEAIDRLSPRTREVYLLSRSEGLRNAQIAEKLGISIYTVKEHLAKALASIREFLDGRLDLVVATVMLYFYR
jgi:RNA polymerase sigma-70 factor (ECF subfamily)